MKFYFLIMSVLGHSMTCSDNSKRCFIVISNSNVQTEPIVGELLPPLLPSQKAGIGACDVTGRGSKS